MIKVSSLNNFTIFYETVPYKKNITNIKLNNIFYETFPDTFYDTNITNDIFYDKLPDTFYIKYNRLIKNIHNIVYKILFPQCINTIENTYKILVPIFIEIIKGVCYISNKLSNFFTYNLYIIILFINICYIIKYNSIISKYQSLLLKRDRELYMYKNKISKIQRILSTRNLKYNNMTSDELYKKINLPYFKQCNKYVMSDILRLNDKLKKIKHELA